MHTTTHTKSSDPRGLGAIWLGLSGAALLVAAAAAFVAVRWDQLSLGPRAAILAAVTCLFMVAGRRLAPAVPTTGSILFHVGALLVAIDIVSLTIALGASLPAGLLIGGLTSMAGHGYLSMRLDSVVFRWAALIGTSVAAGGLAILSGLPAGILLGLVALGAVALRHDDEALVLAGVAGLAPLAVLIERIIAPAATPFAELGYVAALPAAGLATGIIAALGLGIIAQARSDQRLAVAALLAVGVGFADGFAALEHTMPAVFGAVAAAFVLVGLSALGLETRSVWFVPVRILRYGLEGTAALFTLSYGFGELVEPETSVALAFAAVGFVLAEQAYGKVGFSTLRHGSEWWLTPLIVIATMRAVASGVPAEIQTGAVAVSAAGLVVFLVTSRRAGRDLVAAALVITSVPFATPHLLALPLGLIATAALLFAADHPNRVRRETIALLSVVPVLGTASALNELLYRGTVWGSGNASGLGLTVVALWTVSIVTDRNHQRLPVATSIVRLFALLLAAIAVFEQSSIVAIAAGGLVVAHAIATAVRTRAVRDIGIAAIAAQMASVSVAHLLGTPSAYLGTALFVTTVAIAAAGSLLPIRQRLALVPTLIGLVVSFGLMNSTPQAWADAFIIAGLAGAGFGLTVRSDVLQSLSLAATTIGIWIRLDVGGVSLLEAYLAPLAALMVLNGLAGLRQGESSWVTLGPAMALIGLPAGILLFAGADYGAVHLGTLIGLGLVGSLVGAQRNLAAPLFIGSAAFVAATANGVLASEIAVPTWVWLATSGAVLVAAATRLERQSTTPVEAGRQLVATVQSRFR